MSDEIPITNELAEDPDSSVSSLSTAVLASVGALGTAIRRAGGVIDWFNGEGPGLRNRIRQAAGNVVEAPVHAAQSAARSVGQTVDQGLDATLGALNIPRKSDVARLQDQLAELSLKLDSLVEQPDHK